tara:strand:+ start:29540 stop:29995 length:456 start_codon:yes stop_codon:yes gene_type:complete
MKKLDKIVVIGIGNNTRQDDGLGWAFIEKLEKEGFNEENLFCKYQLMVEDAELISTYKTVIFVDACKTNLKDGFAMERIYPSKEISFSTHEVPPNQVLNLCETIYLKKPKAYMIKIQGYIWDFEIRLSKQAKINSNIAINKFIDDFPSYKS